MTPDYSLSWILPFVRQSIRGRGNFTYENFVWGLLPELEKAGVPGVATTPGDRAYLVQPYPYSEIPWPLRVAFAEAFQYLLNNSFIIPHPPRVAPLNLSNHEYMVTRRGTSWADNIDPLPEDTEGYMKVLRTLVPNLDAVIAQYIREGLSAFDRQTFFAAAVMVGAAAEKAVYLLAESVFTATKDAARQARLRKLIDQRKLSALFDCLEETIKGAVAILPYPLFDGSVTYLMSLFETIRVQRNDAVHPMNAAVSPDSIRLSFQAFPYAVQKSESLRDWCHANPKTF